jgi:hypothetical protein
MAVVVDKEMDPSLRWDDREALERHSSEIQGHFSNVSHTF